MMQEVRLENPFSVGEDRYIECNIYQSEDETTPSLKACIGLYKKTAFKVFKTEPDGKINPDTTYGTSPYIGFDQYSKNGGNEEEDLKIIYGQFVLAVLDFVHLMKFLDYEIVTPDISYRVMPSDVRDYLTMVYNDNR